MKWFIWLLNIVLALSLLVAGCAPQTPVIVEKEVPVQKTVAISVTCYYQITSWSGGYPILMNIKGSTSPATTNKSIDAQVSLGGGKWDVHRGVAKTNATGSWLRKSLNIAGAEKDPIVQARVQGQRWFTCTIGTVDP